MALELYRKHNRNKCTSKDTQKCKLVNGETRPCPAMARGLLPEGVSVKVARTGKVVTGYFRGGLKDLLGNDVGIVRDMQRATEMVREFEKSGKKPETPSSKYVTIEQLRDQFIANKKATNRRSGTLRKYEFLFRQLLAFTEERGIRFIHELTPAKIEEFRNTWTDAALTRQKRDQRLRSLFRYALNHENLQSNPMRGIETIKVADDDSKVRDFSEDEMRRILEAAKVDRDPRIFPLVLLMRYSGLAIADATMLHTSAIKGRQLEIRRVKTNKKVSVRLPQFVVDAILGMKSREHDGYFWWNGESKLESLCDLYRDWHLRRVFETAKVDGTPHMIRHTFVHSLLNQGWSMREVATAIGDKPSTVERYYSKWNSREQEAQNKRMDAANEADPLLKAIAVRGDLLKAQIVSMRQKKTA